MFCLQQISISSFDVRMNVVNLCASNVFFLELQEGDLQIVGAIGDNFSALTPAVRWFCDSRLGHFYALIQGKVGSQKGERKQLE